MNNFTKWEWFLFMLGFDRIVREMQIERSQKVQKSYFDKCQDNKDGWIS